jgi:Putative Flp pilus-assembly TadE/G-like
VLTVRRRTTNGEDGVAVVMVGVMMLPIALLLAFVLETGWWWTHHGHLQTQADAGVLAGGQGPWFFGSGPNGCDETAIETNAREYSSNLGSAITSGGTNAQYTNAPNVHTLINSTNFWEKSGSDFSDGQTPCASLQANNGHLDVKVTEASLPTFLGSIPGFSSVNVHTHARVEIQQLGSGGGALPVGVPDPDPVAGEVFFFNETCGDPGQLSCILDRAPLTKNATNPVIRNGKTLTEWDTGSVNVGIGDSNTGVVIAFSGRTTWTTSGTLTAVCGQTLVECYQGQDSGPYVGLSFIHAFNTAGGTPANPHLGDFRLSKSGCTDTSAPYFILNGDCSIRAAADLDFGSATDVEVALDGPGCPNSGQIKGCPMTIDGTGAICGQAGFYCTQGSLPVIPAGAGPQVLKINWGDRDPVLNKNFKGTFADPQRAYSASDDFAFSGSVEYVEVVDPITGAPKNSVNFTPGTAFKVKVGIQGNLETQAAVSDPAVKLRVIGGSRNQSLDCDPHPPLSADDPGYTNLKEELAYGCWPQYGPNTGQTCPNSPTVLWGTGIAGFAWKCVAVQTGGATNQVPQGLNLRILGDEKPAACPAAGELGHNNWKYDPDGDGKPNIPTGDPRDLFVFVTPFGTFTGSGSGTVPVTNLAEFYITGWTGQGSGFDNPCQGNGDDTAPNPGTIVGHFVKYAGLFPSGTGTGHPCDPTDPKVVTPCIAVLTQ